MRYHLIALFTVFVWGITFVSTKVLLVDFSPFWILLLRFAVGFLGLCVLRPRILALKERRHEVLFVTAGATGVAAYFLMENIALQWATATAVGVIVAAAPLFTALFQAVLGDRSALSARFFLGFVVAMAGLVVVGLGSTGTTTLLSWDTASLLGYLLALGAAVVWAIYSLLVKRIGDLGYETVAATKRISSGASSSSCPSRCCSAAVSPPQAASPTPSTRRTCCSWARWPRRPASSPGA